MNYYYISAENKAEGPVSAEQLQALLAVGTINAATQIAPVGSQQWVPLATAIPVPVTASAAGFIPQPQAGNSLAAAALVLSCVGIPISFLCCGPAGGALLVAGIVCGHVALSKAKDNPAAAGRGLALAGTIVGYAGLALYLVFIVIYIAFFAASVAGSSGDWEKILEKFREKTETIEEEYESTPAREIAPEPEEDLLSDNE